MPDHSDMVAVVTGAALGLGQAHIVRLAADGADVVCIDRSAADETGKLVADTGRRFTALRCDISDPDDVAATAARIEELGGCDILVNNAGVYPLRPIADIDFDTWRRVLAVNLDGLFLLTRALLPSMTGKGWGRIINTTSASVHMAAPGFTAYMTTKMGVIGFTRALASEVGQVGITVNAVGPSLVRTPTTEDPSVVSPFGGGPEEQFEHLRAMQSIKRVQVPSDISGTVSFLASDDAEFITGQTIFVDGGAARAG